MERRTAIKSTVLAIGASMVGTFQAESAKIQSVSIQKKAGNDRIPKKGEQFNEMRVFPDEATGCQTNQITTNRLNNMKPTYSMNTGFSGDEEHTAFCTWNDQGESALVLANVVSGDCTVLDHSGPDNVVQFVDGRCISFIPKTSLMTFRVEKTLFLYDTKDGTKTTIDSLSNESRGKLGYGVGTCDGKSIVYYHVFDSEEYGFQLKRYDIESGRTDIIYEEDQSVAGQLSTNPVNSDYIIIQRSIGPYFKTTKGTCNEGNYLDFAREWIINIRSGEKIPIEPNCPCKFSWHANWSHDGTHAYYHGPSDGSNLAETLHPSPYLKAVKPHFIGVANLNGEVVWENEFPRLYYGHVGSHTTEDAIVVDSLVSERLLSAIHWKDLNSQGMPRIEILGSHNSHNTGKQESHPHPQLSRDGKWLLYNSIVTGRSNLYALKLT